MLNIPLHSGFQNIMKMSTMLMNLWRLTNWDIIFKRPSWWTLSKAYKYNLDFARNISREDHVYFAPALSEATLSFADEVTAILDFI